MRPLGLHNFHRPKLPLNYRSSSGIGCTAWSRGYFQFVGTLGQCVQHLPIQQSRLVCPVVGFHVHAAQHGDTNGTKWTHGEVQSAQLVDIHTAVCSDTPSHILWCRSEKPEWPHFLLVVLGLQPLGWHECQPTFVLLL